MRSSDVEALRAVVHERLRRLLESKTEDEAGRLRLLDELLALLNARNVGAVVRSLSSEEFLSPFGAKALELWLETDAGAAAVWLAGRPEAGEEHARLLVRRFETDPKALADYCAQPVPRSWRAKVLTAASLCLADEAPDQASLLAQQLPPGEARNDAFETIAYAWFVRDVDAASAWLARLGDPELRARLQAVGAKAIATTDPDLGAAWLATAVGQGPLQEDTALCVAELWASREPLGAAEWVRSFGKAELRERATRLVGTRWLQSAPGAAKEWLARTEEGRWVLAQSEDSQE